MSARTAPEPRSSVLRGAARPVFSSFRSAAGVSGLAAELRAPLNSAVVLVHALLRQRQVREEGVPDLQLVLNQLTRVENILSAYTRSDRAEIRPPQLKPHDLAAVAQEAVLTLLAASGEGTRIGLNQDDTLLPVFADGSQLTQVLTTLLLRALERPAPESTAAESTAAESQPGGAPRVQVRTGRRTGPEGQARVFVTVAAPHAPFSAAERAALQGGSGEGSGNERDELGLYIVHRIAAAHGAELELGGAAGSETAGAGTVTLLLQELAEYQI